MPDITVQQQIFESFNKAKRILIPLSPNPSGDSLAAGLACAGFLKKLEKDPYLACAGSVPAKYRFLPGIAEIHTSIESARGFVISVRTQNAPLNELSYHLDEQEEKVNIYLKPKEGRYEPSDVSFKSDKFPYDLIMALGLPSLDLLGKLYDGDTDLFFETPIINIDHHANNEHFGQINLVDITATSTTEILMGLLESFEAGLIDPGIATNLLTGILLETNSFQHIKTTPKAFLTASSLISLGANQQEIIKHLYKTKSVSLLKLWGRALARLKEVPELGLVYTLIREDDLVKSGSGELLGAMEEMANSLSDAKLALMLAEVKSGEIRGYVRIHPNLSSLEVTNLFEARMLDDHLAEFEMRGHTLPEAEADILAKLQKLKAKLG
ncbi:MAG: hypothetical protein AAB871_03150 [Patescibacteria group bacterium]